MRKLFRVGICILSALVSWMIFQNLRALPEQIKKELEKLSVDLTATIPKDRFQAATRKYPNLTRCLIPTDIQNVCVETINRVVAQPECPLEELTKECALLKNIHLYDKPIDQEEIRFPLAFGIKMHTSPEQAEQLLRVIYRPHNVYCIHVDQNADDSVFNLMKSVAACFSNVNVSDRIRFVYAGYETVQAELILMTCAQNSKIDWKYYINLAGQDFPLRTNLEIVRILTALNGTNDIESFPMPGHLKNRITYQHEFKDGRPRPTTILKDPPNFQAYIRKGSQYNAFTREFVTSVLKDTAAKVVLDYFNDTYSPDENVWATINALPGIPGGYPVNVVHTPNNEHLSRAIAWESSDSYSCRGEYVRRVCVFARGDLPWLLRQPNLFANKFRLATDSQVLTCLEAVLDQRARSRGMTVDQMYISSLPHVKFRRHN